jgi:Rieske Fe-S protein
LARRAILRGAFNFVWVLPLGVILKSVFSFLTYESSTTTVTQFSVGNAASLPELPAYIEAARVWLRQDAGGYTAIDAVCTHLGCIVRLQPGGEEYRSPCHGSRFALSGEVLQGPAVRPLPFYRLYWGSDEQLTVDRTQTVDASFRLPPNG